MLTSTVSDFELNLEQSKSDFDSKYFKPTLVVDKNWLFSDCGLLIREVDR